MVNLSDSKNKSCELLEAQAHIWNHIFNFINSMSLKCAVELGIPEIIHTHPKPITISELNAALSIHPSKAHCLPRLMRVLIHSGIFALAKINTKKDEQGEEEEEGYVLTNSSQLLLKDNPFSILPYLLAMLDPICIKPWDFSSTWFLNEDPSPFQTAHGMGFWDYAGRDSKLNNLFNEGMAGDSRLVTSILIDQGKEVFHGLNSIVDVGGGTGTVAKAIAQAFPHIQCTVLDLPQVVDGLHNTPNLKFVAGNMFDSVPPADAILLKWILHDWSVEECLKILDQCKKAIKERGGGKVIIIDMVKENQKEDNVTTETQLFFDMLMMVLVTGKERNEKEWSKLFFAAGFSSYKIIPVMGLRSIIEVYP
ncbi:trans-resveratrol di-O-methyltransferase-like [Euphorbia lathyris]|uniref:trans-resveratrol di-O-methyltransferase-like n=1 Tax=Euphorbia lathyris TaxID=212925 RepID=UPI00331331D7